MPGIVVFRRRWSVGSDDLVVPGVFLFTVHLIWTLILTILLGLVQFNRSIECVLLLWILVIGYLTILGLSMTIELWICIVAMRGSILDTAPRAAMQYILYIRVLMMFCECGWLSAGIAWLVKYYVECPIETAKETVLSMIVFNLCILLSVLITCWCTYDTAGRSWVKMKQYQRSMRQSESKFQYKRSGSTRNWRQRKVIRAYQDSWHQRCRFLFCCATSSDRNRNSFADIARLLSDFFRDLDVVPSDVIAGLVLLRKFQKIERKAIIEQHQNDTYEFLSGVAITPRTQFLSLHEGADLELFQTVIHYANYAVRAYGWPIYVMMSKMGACKLCTNLRCCTCVSCHRSDQAEIVADNCCQCNYAVLKKLLTIGDIEIIYATYHVDVGETPFFVALDYDRKKLVICVRGTISMQDILTDLNAEGETLPLHPPREEWLGHKGMVQAAQYIFDKLHEEQLIERALQHCPDRGTDTYEIVTVGHSLGAGTASILGILLRQHYPSLQSFCYSPPGGLLSMPAVEYTKEFTVSVVVGKDVVPRIGLNQLESLRADLINAIKRSVDPKWKTITCSMVCCGCSQPTSAVELSTGESDVGEYMRTKRNARCGSLHPADSSIALTSHQPLYPPGRIIHVVRHHPTRGDQVLSKNEPVYQALWVENVDFDEVLISPVMIQDHMPDKVLDALNKVVTTLGPRKPQRTSISSATTKYCDIEDTAATSNASPPPPPPQSLNTNTQHRLYLETSFTSLQSPTSSSVAPSHASSSMTNNFCYSTTCSQPSPMFPPLTSSLSLTLKRRSTPSPTMAGLMKLDLIHDDWFGLAPLASPESLSELSSISSRASLIVAAATTKTTTIGGGDFNTPKIMRRTPKIIGNLSTCADDIRNVRNFQMAKIFQRRCSTTASDSPSTLGRATTTMATSSSSNVSYESAASSLPHKCSPIRSIMSNVNATSTGQQHQLAISDSGDDFQSAEDILDNVLTSAGCKDYFNSPQGFLETHFDLLLDEPPSSVLEQICCSPTASTPTTTAAVSSLYQQHQDPDVISNFAIDLSLNEEHRSRQFTARHHPYSNEAAAAASSSTTTTKANSIDSGGGSVCRTPSDTKIVTFNPQVINIDTTDDMSSSASIESSSITKSPVTKQRIDRWRIFRRRRRRNDNNTKSNKHDNTTKDRSDLDVTNTMRFSGVVTTGERRQQRRRIVTGDVTVPKTILCTTTKMRRCNNGDDDDDQGGFSRRTEQLPLLSGLSSACGERTSPSFVQRKKYVYPADLTFVSCGGGSSSGSSNNNNSSSKGGGGESSV